MSVRERRVRDNPPYLEAGIQNSKGDRMIGWGHTFSGLGSQVTGYRARVVGFGYGCGS